MLRSKIIYISKDKESEPAEFARLENLGAKVIAFSTIKIVPVQDFSELDKSLKSINDFDYIIFTSINSVKIFGNRLSELGINSNSIASKIIAIGEKTASICREFNFRVDIVPAIFSSGGIVEYFSNQDIRGKKFLLPVSKIANNKMKNALELTGASVTRINIYDNVLPGESDLKNEIDNINRNMPNIFAFTSPSSFNNFLILFNITDVKKYFTGKTIVPIGNTTKAEIEKRGVEDLITPVNSTVKGIVETIINRFGAVEI